MCERMDNVKIVPGRFINVENTTKPKFSNAKNEYLLVVMEDAGGDNKRCLLFTEREVEMAKQRALKNKENLLKKYSFKI